MGVTRAVVVSNVTTQSRVLSPWGQRHFCEFVCSHVCGFSPGIPASSNTPKT